MAIKILTLDDLSKEIMKYEKICFSGGATGADFYWDLMCKKNNIKTFNFSFLSHRYSTSEEDTYILSRDLLMDADDKLKIANQSLGRKLYIGDEKSGMMNLLRRNYYQIAFTDQIYGVGKIKSERSMSPQTAIIRDKFEIDGGTAWAVQMYADSKKENKKITFYCQKRKKVLSWDFELNYWKVIDQDTFVKPSDASVSRFTGIGSRDLDEFGKYFIIDSFN